MEREIGEIEHMLMHALTEETLLGLSFWHFLREP